MSNIWTNNDEIKHNSYECTYSEDDKFLNKFYCWLVKEGSDSLELNGEDILSNMDDEYYSVRHADDISMFSHTPSLPSFSSLMPNSNSLEYRNSIEHSPNSFTSTDSVFSFSEKFVSIDNNDMSFESSDYCYSDSDENKFHKPLRKVGRPPKGSWCLNKRNTPPAKKIGKLWEFLRNLLLDEKTCPSLIKWDNHQEGTFKFVQCEKVAKLWGDRKQNDKMNYEKLSRAMRYYYRSQVLLPVAGKRLVYKFGPYATGWMTSNPILN